MRSGKVFLLPALPVAVIVVLIVTGILPGATGSVEGQTAPQYFQRGMDALKRGIPVQDTDLLLQGADSFRRALDFNPQYVDARQGLAEALIWLGEVEQAEMHLQRVRELKPVDSSLDLLEARAHVLAGRIEEARILYRAVLQREPYNTLAQVGSAILNLADGHSTRAMDRLQVLEQRFPENRQLLTALVEIAWARNQNEDVQRYLAMALRYHGDIPSVQIMAARIALQNRDGERGEYHARNAIALAPHMQEGWMLLARAAHLQGQMDQARVHYEQLISLEPANHRAWYARGVLAAETGDFPAAYGSWERALRIRPDYELATIALESTLVAQEPMDSDRRAAAAVPYRETGQDLESRFLHRQAERHYRRGLQIHPFDTVLRQHLADLYRAQDLWGRYVRELEILQDLLPDNRDVAERIETFRRLRRDFPAERRRVDQFTAPRERTSLAVFYSQDPLAMEPQAGRYIAEYLVSLLRTSQNVTVTAVEPARGDRVTALARARALHAERAVIIESSLGEHHVTLDVAMLDRRTGEALLSRRIRRDGVGMVERAIRDASNALVSIIDPVGIVLDRRGDEVLVSLGTVDGLETGDTILFHQDLLGPSIGSGTVTALDDLVAEASFAPHGSDTLTIGNFARPVAEEDGREAETPPVRDQEEQTSRLKELLIRLFTLP